MSQIALIIPYYISWHYSRSFREYVTIWKNFYWFLMNFFSIRFLLKTLFEPFQRLQESTKGSQGLEDYFSRVITNFMMRLVGLLFRSALIVFGLISIVALTISGLIGLFVWALLPFFMVYIFIVGIIGFISAL